jgi:DnaJ like chaperone protein
MSWWGKVFGGTFGYLLGGPLGAALGAALGHNLDRGISDIRKEEADVGFGNIDQERAQTAFFTATFSLMGYLAKIDGQVNEGEISLAQTVMAQMNLDADQKKAAMQLFNEGKRPGFPFKPVLFQFKIVCHARRDIMRMFIEILLHAAYSDGEMHVAEKNFLLQICEILDFTRSDFEKFDAMIRAQRNFAGTGTWSSVSPQQVLENAYAILGVTAASSVEEVKKAYRRLINQHHPDKLVAKGLPEEMMKIATEKTHEIKTAYEQIRSARRF